MHFCRLNRDDGKFRLVNVALPKNLRNFKWTKSRFEKSTSAKLLWKGRKKNFLVSGLWRKIVFSLLMLMEFQWGEYVPFAVKGSEHGLLTTWFKYRGTIKHRNTFELHYSPIESWCIGHLYVRCIPVLNVKIIRAILQDINVIFLYLTQKIHRQYT